MSLVARDNLDEICTKAKLFLYNKTFLDLVCSLSGMDASAVSRAMNNGENRCQLA